jgi:hypothetical protein
MYNYYTNIIYIQYIFHWFPVSGFVEREQNGADTHIWIYI